MKNDIKKYLTLGAALAGSAFMVSCDGDDVTVVQDTGVADAIGDLGTKPVAPIKLAEYPVTSLKLTFDNDTGSCLGQSFDAGTELELDFDSVDVTSADDTNANGLADLAVDGGLIFANNGTQEGYVQGITNLASTFTIDFVKQGTNASGNILLSELTFTPFASDLRSVTGRFTGVGPVDVNVNQDTTHVIGDSGDLALNNITLPDSSSASVNQVSVYQDVAGNPAEITTLNGVTLDSEIGGGNVILSVELNTGCVLNFAVSKTAYAAAGGVISPSSNTEVQSAYNSLVGTLGTALASNALDVSPEGDQIPDTVGAATYLTAGNGGEGITGSYRHDYDSSTGSPETIINSENQATNQNGLGGLGGGNNNFGSLK